MRGYPVYQTMCASLFVAVLSTAPSLAADAARSLADRFAEPRVESKPPPVPVRRQAQQAPHASILVKPAERPATDPFENYELEMLARARAEAAERAERAERQKRLAERAKEAAARNKAEQQKADKERRQAAHRADIDRMLQRLKQAAERAERRDTVRDADRITSGPGREQARVRSEEPRFDPLTTTRRAQDLRQEDLRPEEDPRPEDLRPELRPDQLDAKDRAERARHARRLLGLDPILPRNRRQLSGRDVFGIDLDKDILEDAAPRTAKATDGVASSGTRQGGEVIRGTPVPEAGPEAGEAPGWSARNRNTANSERGQGRELRPALTGIDPKVEPVESVTVLLVMERGHRGVRRFNKFADPVICTRRYCFVSMGPQVAARQMRRGRTFGTVNTLGRRAGSCNNRLTCVFRDLPINDDGITVRPVDLRWVRHDRRERNFVRPDHSCRARAGRLICRRPVISKSYRMWIVPEKLAQLAGPDGIRRALETGLSAPATAANVDRN